MQATQVYATALGGTIFALTLINISRRTRRLFYPLKLAVSHLSYIRVLRRFKHIGPWNLTAAIPIIFLCINTYLVFFKGFFNLISAKETSIRAVKLSLINLVPTLAGPSQSFHATNLGVSLKTFQKLHRSLALVSILQIAFHITITVFVEGAFSLAATSNIWALAATISLVFQIILSLPWLRRPYELFARSHQLLAVILPFLIWQHMVPDTNIYIFLLLGSFPLGLLLQICALLYRKAIGITIITNLKDIVQRRLDAQFHAKELDIQIHLRQDVVQIDLILSHPVQVREGQYIGLWIPGLSKSSFLQIHPFMVTSWSEGDAKQLRLLVEPRQGWTKTLLESTSCRAVFTGPYGVSVPTRQYGIVLLVASGFGIVAQIPYIKRLIHGYNTRRTRTRRIHLVWLLRTPDLACLLEDTLNEALHEDSLDNGCIFSISTYVESGGAGQYPQGRRAISFGGIPNMKEIIEAERNGNNIRRVQEEEKRREDMLVLVSGRKDLRDQLCKIAQSHLFKQVTFIELEYQPDSDV